MSRAKDIKAGLKGYKQKPKFILPESQIAKEEKEQSKREKEVAYQKYLDDFIANFRPVPFGEAVDTLQMIYAIRSMCGIKQ